MNFSNKKSSVLYAPPFFPIIEGETIKFIEGFIIDSTNHYTTDPDSIFSRGARVIRPQNMDKVWDYTRSSSFYLEWDKDFYGHVYKCRISSSLEYRDSNVESITLFSGQESKYTGNYLWVSPAKTHAGDVKVLSASNINPDTGDQTLTLEVTKNYLFTYLGEGYEFEPVTFNVTVNPTLWLQNEDDEIRVKYLLYYKGFYPVTWEDVTEIGESTETSIRQAKELRLVNELGDDAPAYEDITIEDPYWGFKTYKLDTPTFEVGMIETSTALSDITIEMIFDAEEQESARVPWVANQKEKLYAGKIIAAVFEDGRIYHFGKRGGRYTLTSYDAGTPATPSEADQTSGCDDYRAELNDGTDPVELC